MEREYILSNQPVELLVKQLSDPSVTLKDIKNLCATSRQTRKLCNTHPLLRGLIEGKRTAVVINRKSRTERLGYIVQKTNPDIFKFSIYAYVGELFVTIHFTIDPPGKTIERFFIDVLKNIKTPAQHWSDYVGYEEELNFSIDPISQRVTIRVGTDWDPLTKIGTLPYVLFESAMTEAQRMVDNGEYGKLRILINGDVQYLGSIE